MAETPPNTDFIHVRLARTPVEIEAAQALRYHVFYEEHAARPSAEMARLKRDFDDYDPHADHLIVVDERQGAPRIVGTYRLLSRAVAEKYGRFYTSGEYNIDSILNSGASVLELGRSCVLPEYRTRPVLQMLWQGIADYVLEHKIEMLFGCASFHGTDPQALARPLSYLYHYHLAPEALRPVALPERYVSMNMIPKEQLNPKEILGELPPLIKGYLRIGSLIGDGAVIDEQFGTTDVCIMLHTQIVANHYKKHYERKGNKSFTAPAFLAEGEDVKIAGGSA
ncbi:MAG: GNAT family N-acetyltransferase [Micavibrio aeruginosavorus]|nr:GNAT family N-acetyltransferase [Micavibrio aeruginosavorus]